ncbi:DUF389 domain-containing protein [Halobacteria archaeon AArc-curdl1]|uniref:DUF389 domain-containing protein n=1 Tax=Natronosalvus hydrolyticus TaxID=2979988 RepID=A0AAP2ZAD7_9EURY|nr:DUF389 domain-containing protein [Halobacteria archaeon AArc-curdl1]
MRTLYVRVPERCRNEVLETLAELDVEYAILGTESPAKVPAAAESGTGSTHEGALFQIPVPADAVGPVLDALEDAGVDTNQYTVILSGEVAMTSTWEMLMDRYAKDFDPLTISELRSKAMNLSQDSASYYALMFLSALIATVGLLADSPAIVVGSMVIAPVVGPVLTASVGAISGDRRMVLGSLQMQAYGLAVAVLAATALSFTLQAFRFVPPVLDLSAIELVGVRLAPNILALIAGLAAGAAGGIGLTTKGPMSLIGVMMAAALIPTAAASGLGVIWDRPVVWIGTLALLLVTIVMINIACFGVLWALYRPTLIGEAGVFDFQSTRETALFFAVLAVLIMVVVGTAGASAQQIAFERTVNEAVHDVIEGPENDDLTVVTVRSKYADPSPFTDPQTVTVVVSDTDPEEPPPPDLAGGIAEEIATRSDSAVTVRVQFLEYQETTASVTDRRDAVDNDVLIRPNSRTGDWEIGEWERPHSIGSPIDAAGNDVKTPYRRNQIGDVSDFINLR